MNNLIIREKKLNLNLFYFFIKKSSYKKFRGDKKR